MKRLAMLSLVLFAVSLIPTAPAEACPLGKAVLRAAGKVVSAPFRAARSRRAGRGC